MHERKALFHTLMKSLGLGDRPQSFIGGELCDGVGDTISLEDPYARIVLTEYADCGASLSDRACEQAQLAQVQWGALDP